MVEVGRVWATGLYNPQTVEGNVVVEGLQVSTFTEAVEPVVACALLLPFRAGFMATGGLFGWMGQLLRNGGQGVERLLPRGSVSYL